MSVNMYWKQKIRLWGRNLKRFYYIRKYKLKNVHPTFYIGGKSQISSDLEAEAYVYIGPKCVIYPMVKIGAYSMLANNVSVIGGDHAYTRVGIPIIFSGREGRKNTLIGRDCWIGAHAIIMTGVKIGDGTIVGAGTIVTKNLDPYSIYAGVPAKKIKNRFDNVNDQIAHQRMILQSPEDFPSNLIQLPGKL